MVWAAPAERPSRAERDDAPENVGAASLPAEAGARAAVFEELVSAESADRPLGVRPALSEVETGAKDAAGAREPSPDDSAGLAVWLEPAMTGEVPPPPEVADTPPNGAVPGVPPAGGCEARPPGLGAAAAAAACPVGAAAADPACAGAGTVLPPPAGEVGCGPPLAGEPDPGPGGPELPPPPGVGGRPPRAAGPCDAKAAEARCAAELEGLPPPDDPGAVRERG